MCIHVLYTIFASLASANERVHVHSEVNFPQAKRDSKINVLFLLKEHGELYFLLLNNSVQIIFLNLKKVLKLLSEGKKDIGESLYKKRTLECKL